MLDNEFNEEVELCEDSDFGSAYSDYAGLVQEVRRLESEAESRHFLTDAWLVLDGFCKTLEMAAQGPNKPSADEWQSVCKRIDAVVRPVLTSSDVNALASAVSVMRVIGRPVDEAIGPLSRFLNADHEMVRRIAARSLRNLTPSPAVFALAAANVEHWEPFCRAAAISVLGISGTDTARRACLLALRDKRAPVREAAIDSITRLGVDPLEYGDLVPALLSDPSKYVRKAMDAALKQSSNSSIAHVMPPTIAHRVGLLRNSNALIRASACDELAALGPEAVSALPLLMTLLEDPKPNVRASAAGAVASIGANDEQVREQLKDFLRNFDDPRHEAALFALNKSKYRGVDLQSDLLRILLNEAHPYRLLALKMLAELDGSKENVVSALITTFGSPDPKMRSAACHTATQITDDPKLLSSFIEQGLRDPEAEVRHAATILAGKSPTAALKCSSALLDTMLHDEENYIRSTAHSALHNVESLPVQYVARLSAALHCEDVSIVAVAAQLLGEYGSLAEEAVPKLLELYAGGDLHVKTYAAGAVIKIKGADFWRTASWGLDKDFRRRFPTLFED